MAATGKTMECQRSPIFFGMISANIIMKSVRIAEKIPIAREEKTAAAYDPTRMLPTTFTVEERITNVAIDRNGFFRISSAALTPNFPDDARRRAVVSEYEKRD